MTTSEQIITQLSALADSEIAVNATRFFKSSGEPALHSSSVQKNQSTQQSKSAQPKTAQKFWGIRVPALRELAKQSFDTPLNEITKLLYHDHHETRLLAAFMLVQVFEKNKQNQAIQSQVFNLYLQHSKQFNNWDLVDSSAHKICGPYLFNQLKNTGSEKPSQNTTVLYEYAKSDNIWQRRIAIMTTFYFIKQDCYQHTLTLAKILLNDEQDLIHKAVGWMLREVGNRNLAVECEFLNQHYKTMPRTMLRYAIEKFDKPLRLQYLQGLI